MQFAITFTNEIVLLLHLRIATRTFAFSQFIFFNGYPLAKLRHLTYHSLPGEE